MVILDQCGKSPQQKWLKFSQNAYLANTKRILEYGIGLVLGLNNFFREGVRLGWPGTGPAGCGVECEGSGRSC